ncbi:MAG: N-acetyltransferase [Calditrichaeota bacterium]|nr:MAG: N-acetyltransferase [Calditrichota bacterium]MBL1205558.1 N-acetyltransferase [Calditrichota bacterium]NOG45387.1 GNAT family N-acetyltransferase [Calditrichota bacterium]
MILDLNRLKLIPATQQLIEADINNPNELAELLNVQKPYNWPPPLNDELSQEFYLNFVKNHPNDLGWGMWYFLLKNKSDKKDILVGDGGFKGIPNDKGEVEIGYSVIGLYHKRGIATEAAKGLIEWAFSNKSVKKIVAHTMVGLRPSIRVLEKNYFRLAGNTKQKGIIRFELNKTDFLERGHHV